MPKSVAGIIKKDQKFLLGKRKPGGSIGGKWEFPGGKVESKESLEDALKREFLEELDVEIEVNKFIVMKDFSTNGHKFKLYAFYIDLKSDNIKYNEHDKFDYFTIDEIKKLGDNFADSDKLLLEHL
ncbi:NUDIX domain-containing protein [Thiospirochaeta perfilievii]|uniref:8-oxo-dGTP diphosphatase n=1 Tax=Thiospirochaeta perfilievii TaxID=252967 RepID=A0A5C1QGM7_9SPIO|nr:NUDIX domain-containing protein [Thiospirochaeta perfilievii]QEN05774.1 NUDIX domain-containing protein [Thiospirochaeta perfilievii]